MGFFFSPCDKLFDDLIHHLMGREVSSVKVWNWESFRRIIRIEEQLTEKKIGGRVYDKCCDIAGFVEEKKKC